MSVMHLAHAWAWKVIDKGWLLLLFFSLLQLFIAHSWFHNVLHAFLSLADIQVCPETFFFLKICFLQMEMRRVITTFSKFMDYVHQKKLYKTH